MHRSLSLLALVLFSSAASVQAATPADACANLGEARTQLVAMLGESDKAKLDGLKAKVHAASDKLDKDLAAMASGPDASKVTAFKPAWEAFKQTRETEIIPALYAGDKEKAKGLATGVQAGRMKEMKAAMGCQ
jgi:Skp family chaperone for outer membrane proteins